MKNETPSSMIIKSLKLLAESKVLDSESTKLSQEISDLDMKYTDEVIDNLSWEEKELFLKTYDELVSKFNESLEKLLKLEEEFNIIRKEINDFYGKELIKDLPYAEPIKPLNDENEDEGDDKSADWWKSV